LNDDVDDRCDTAVAAGGRVAGNGAKGSAPNGSAANASLAASSVCLYFRLEKGSKESSRFSEAAGAAFANGAKGSALDAVFVVGL
jgi:hypothetical protein